MPFIAKILAGLVMGAVVILISSREWKLAGRSILFVVVAEGILRKWLIPSASDFIYFLKDWILIGCFMGMIQERKSVMARNWRGLQWFLGLLALFTFLETFNPTMASPIAGIMGVKSWLLWTLFIFVVPQLFDSLAELERYLRQYAVVFLAVAALAAVQLRLPPSHFLNQYVAPQDIASFGEKDLVRVCGPFSYLTGFTNYLSFCSVLFLPAAIYFRGKEGFLMQNIVVPLLLGVSAMTGARSMLFYMGIFIPLFVFLGVFDGSIRIEKVTRMVLLSGALTVGLVFGSSDFRDAFNGLMQRNSDLTYGNDTAFARTFGGYIDVFSPRLFSWFGEGVGATGEASRNIANMAGFPVADSVRYSEHEAGRLMIETGFFGLLLWTAFKIYLYLCIFVMFRARRNPVLRGVSLAVFLNFIILSNNSPVFDHTLAPLYWFSVGLIFLMEKLDVHPSLRPRVHQRFASQPRRPKLFIKGSV